MHKFEFEHAVVVILSHYLNMLYKECTYCTKNVFRRPIGLVTVLSCTVVVHTLYTLAED